MGLIQIRKEMQFTNKQAKPSEIIMNPKLQHFLHQIYNKKLFMKEFADFLSSHRYLPRAIAQRRQEIIISKLPSNPDFTIGKNKKDYISCRLPLKEISLHECFKFSKQLDEQGIDARFAKMFPKGTNNPFVDQAFRGYGEEYGNNPRYINHQHGQVVLVTFGCTNSLLEYMATKMVQNEVKWGNAVRVISIGRFNCYPQQIQHLELECDCSCNFFQSQLQIQNSLVCLIDKFGKVDYSMADQFQFGQLDFQARINYLLAQVQEEPLIAPQQKPIIKPSASILQTIDPYYFQEKFKNAQFLCVKTKLLSRLDRGHYSQHATLQACIYDDDNDTFIALKELFEGRKDTQLTINQVKRVKVPELKEPHCAGCKKVLSYPFYWLYWEDGEKFACTHCVEKPSSKPEQHFSYRKNSVLLNGKWDFIILDDLGENLQPQDISQARHKVWCSLCNYPSYAGQARYICLGCREYGNFTEERLDICQECHQKDVSKILSEKIPDHRHNEGHPLLRILYHTKNDRY